MCKESMMQNHLSAYTSLWPRNQLFAFKVCSWYTKLPRVLWLPFKYVIPLIAHHLILDYVVPTPQSLAKCTFDQKRLECPCGIWLSITVLRLNNIFEHSSKSYYVRTKLSFNSKHHKCHYFQLTSGNRFNDIRVLWSIGGHHPNFDHKF